MSNHSKLRYLVVLLFAAFATAALVSADFGALAQNANSSSTGDDSAQNANMSAMPRRGGRRRRHRARRRAAAAAAADAAAGAAAPGPAADDTSERPDLSGTYTGHVKMSGGWDLDGDGTLTITGNTFQLESGGATHGGRVYAVTTRGYTGAAFYFTDLSDPATGTSVVANVRARKVGDRIWLTPVPSASSRLWFSSGGGMRGGGGRHRGRRRHHARRPAAPPAATTGDGTTPPV